MLEYAFVSNLKIGINVCGISEHGLSKLDSKYYLTWNVLTGSDWMMTCKNSIFNPKPTKNEVVIL